MGKNLDITCPFCGEKGNVEPYEDRMHCTLCDMLFDDEDIIREDIRHQVSHILIDTDENDQMWVHIPLSGPVKSVDTFLDEKTLAALNGLDEIVVDRMYQIPGDGTIWLRVQGLSLQNGGTDEELWLAFDDLSTDDLRKVLHCIEGRQGGAPLEIEVPFGYCPSDFHHYEGYGDKWIPVGAVDDGLTEEQDICDDEIRRLWEYMNGVANALAEKVGANIDYSPSVDFSVLPYVVAVMAPEQCDGLLDNTSEEDLLKTFEFLAEGNGWLPKFLIGSSLQGYKDYIVANKKSIVGSIWSVVEGYYEEYILAPIDGKA